MDYEYLLVDGYNIIFAWDDLKELADVNLDAARGKLADVLSNLAGYKNCILILVFDGYKVKNNPGEVIKYHNIHIVYTKEAETADMYIERVTQNIGHHANVMVATSDRLEQMIVIGSGAYRMSARDLKKEVKKVRKEMEEKHLKKRQEKNYLFNHLPEEWKDYVEDVRLGKQDWDGNRNPKNK